MTHNKALQATKPKLKKPRAMKTANKVKHKFKIGDKVRVLEGGVSRPNYKEHVCTIEALHGWEDDHISDSKGNLLYMIKFRSKDHGPGKEFNQYNSEYETYLVKVTGKKV
jgi:hypothetical protein